MSLLRSRSGGHADGHHVEAVVEILAEGARPDGLAQVGVGGRDHAHVHLDGAGAAEPLDLALLERAQQLGLEVDAQAADLVEEERAAVGQLELAELARVGAGEGALLVAEQLGLEQGVGDRGQVDRHERLGAPRALVVDGARHQLLAGAALRGDRARWRGSAPPGRSSRRAAPSAGGAPRAGRSRGRDRARRAGSAARAPAALLGRLRARGPGSRPRRTAWPGSRRRPPSWRPPPCAGADPR